MHMVRARRLVSIVRPHRCDQINERNVYERLRQVCTVAAVLLEWKVESRSQPSALFVGRDFRLVDAHPLRHLILCAVVIQMLIVRMFRLD